MLYYFLTIAVFLLAYVTGWYFYSQKIDRLDVADEAWGLAQPYIVLVAILASGNYHLAPAILFFIALFWGYRLFSHIHKRHSRSSSEDIRYVEMRANWKRFPRLKSYIYVFLFQGFLMYVLGMASMLLVFSKTNWSSVSLIGLAIWIVGYFFETVADGQLKDFLILPENKGKIMDQGLWKYSRHPNYFGEVVMWWGIFTFVFLNTNILWAIITPITITYLIVFVSGIPLTEKHFEKRPGWEEYKKRTSALIPWPNHK